MHSQVVLDGVGHIHALQYQNVVYRELVCGLQDVFAEQHEKNKQLLLEQPEDLAWLFVAADISEAWMELLYVVVVAIEASSDNAQPALDL